MTEGSWPELPYEEWRATRDTLHMYTQVMGKLRLALSPFEPEWGNVPLYLTARGLTTSPIPIGRGSLDAEIDLVDHALVIRTSDGRMERRPLGGAVARLPSGRHERAGTAAGRCRHVRDPIRGFKPRAVSRTIANTPPMNRGSRHALLPSAVAGRPGPQAASGAVRHRATPVQFFWGTFDLALVRYSGRRVIPLPDAGVISRFSADAEEICAGWWPGDERVPDPAFYAYAFPKPEGIEKAAIEPREAAWSDTAGEFILPYEQARSLPDPEAAVLDFLGTTYACASALMGWDPDLTRVSDPPSGSAVRSSETEDET